MNGLYPGLSFPPGSNTCYYLAHEWRKDDLSLHMGAFACNQPKFKLLAVDDSVCEIGHFLCIEFIL